MEKELDTIRKDFSKYLDSLGISAKTHKNYRSDISHFSGWLILKIRTFGSYVEDLTGAVPFLSNDLANEYKNYMVENTTPLKTINRRLSTLRHLSKFLLASQIIDTDFMIGIENSSEAKVIKEIKMADHPSIGEFRSYLESEKISPNTIKNYLSDIRQFMIWLENNQQLNNSTK